ncbi:hypothetical protein NECAME_15478 [Necator americanus]|uniref:Endonuclease/exonuclease/phosphatase family protein n=1 Tax=Necator americanus TaxID=51031 RepID=W2SHX1_NECAM|nr:hypothetical protein NECAME_15478 [Necator americanus]ETN69168.1 hypothetical protein NECAME_15478 [Necator americanus]
MSAGETLTRNRKESSDSGGNPGTVAPGGTGLQESCRLPKRKRTRMAICTYNARTLASEAAIEDLMMQAKKINVRRLTERRRRHPLNAIYETGEELFLGTCDSRDAGGGGVLVNTRTAKIIDSFEQLTTRIGRLHMRRCGSTPALTIFVAYAPTSSYEEEEVEAFYMDLEKFYREDHAFYKVIIGDFNAKFRRRNPRTIINWDLFATLAGFWEDSAMDNIDKEYDRFVEHLLDCTRKTESFKTTKRRLSLETLELIRQRGAARVAGNQELTSVLARLCREAIKEDLKERRAEVHTVNWDTQNESVSWDSINITDTNTDKPVNVLQAAFVLPNVRTLPLLVVGTMSGAQIFDVRTQKLLQKQNIDIGLVEPEDALPWNSFCRGITCNDNTILEHSGSIADMATCRYDEITCSGDCSGTIIVWSKNIKGVQLKIATQ